MCTLIPFSTCLFLLPLLTKASISNANIYKKQTMSAATELLCYSFLDIYAVLHLFRLVITSFPVAIIILQHAADPISNTSHFHLQPAGPSWFPAVFPKPPTPITWCRGQRDRPAVGEWKWKDGEMGVGL